MVLLQYWYQRVNSLPCIWRVWRLWYLCSLPSVTIFSWSGISALQRTALSKWSKTVLVLWQPLCSLSCYATLRHHCLCGWTSWTLTSTRYWRCCCLSMSGIHSEERPGWLGCPGWWLSLEGGWRCLVYALAGGTAMPSLDASMCRRHLSCCMQSEKRTNIYHIVFLLNLKSLFIASKLFQFSNQK